MFWLSKLCRTLFPFSLSMIIQLFYPNFDHNLNLTEKYKGMVVKMATYFFCNIIPSRTQSSQSPKINIKFLQRVSIACYAERCISHDRFCLTVRPSDRLTVACHTLVSCQNDSSYDHAVFTGG